MLKYSSQTSQHYWMNQISQLFIIFLLATSCIPSGENTSELTSSVDRAAFLKGQTLYKQNCAQCHQANGAGLKKIYPPLAQSDYLINNTSKAIQFIKHGTSEPIVVNGQRYAFNMPSNTHLSNEEIAQIMTYISNAWGNQAGTITIEDVQKALNDSIP